MKERYKSEAMLILSLDTSSKRDSISLLGKELIFDASIYSNTKSEKILENINSFLSLSSFNLSDLDAIAVCLGPGSYTGTRIGIATALGLSKALEIPVYGIDLFEILEFYGQGIPFIERKGKIYIKEEKVREADPDFFNKHDNYVTESDLNFSKTTYLKGLTKSEIMARIVQLDIKKSMSSDLTPLYI